MHKLAYSILFPNNTKKVLEYFKNAVVTSLPVIVGIPFFQFMRNAFVSMQYIFV